MEGAMRTALVIATSLLIMAGFTVAAQEKAKEEMKPKAGHEMMTTKSTGSASTVIAQAMSAAPQSVSKDATVMQLTPDGEMNQLRAGTNGWMCMVEPDGTPMCLDKEWQAWADGWVNKKDPQVKAIGVA